MLRIPQKYFCDFKVMQETAYPNPNIFEVIGLLDRFSTS